MIEKTIKLILRFHLVFIVGLLLLTAILVFWFAKVEIGASLTGLMPPKHDPEHIFLDKVATEFGSYYFLVISVTNDNLFSSPTLSKIQKLTSEISAHPFVVRVQSLTNANIVKSKDNELYVENISDKIPKTKRGIEGFREDIMQNPLYAGKLISDDERTTVITVYFEETAPERSLREKQLRKSVREIRDLALAAAGPEEIHVAGVPAGTASFYEMLLSDLSTLVPVSIIIIFLILLINFRSWRCALISLLPISIALIWTYSFMAILKIPVFVLTSIIPPIAAALGISYGVHWFTEYFRQRHLQGNSAEILGGTMRNVMLAILLSAITTAIGFATLAIVDITAIREFSAFLVIAVLSLLILITLFIPSILFYIRPKLRAITVVGNQSLKKSSNRFVDWIVGHRYAVLIFSVLLGIACTLGLARLRIDMDIMRFFKRSAPIKQAMEFMAEHIHGTYGVTVAIEGEKEGDMEDPSLLKSIEQLQLFLDQQPSVGKTTSIADYIKLVNKAFHDNNPAYYLLPESKRQIAQYLLAYSLADPQGTLDEYIDYNHRMALVTLKTTDTSSTSLLRLKRLIEQECSKLFPPGVSYKVTSDAMIVAMSTQIIARKILFSFGLAATAISIIMILLFRSFKVGVVAMIPNLLPLLLILALMGWARINFNLATSIIICVAIGIAVDDTIHFMTRYFHELQQTNHYLIRRYTDIKITSDQIRSIRITFNRLKRPIILTSAIIFLGFITLVLSQFVPIIWFGALTALTMVFCLLCDLILLPALLASISI